MCKGTAVLLFAQTIRQKNASFQCIFDLNQCNVCEHNIFLEIETLYNRTLCNIRLCAGRQTTTRAMKTGDKHNDKKQGQENILRRFVSANIFFL